MTRPWLSVRRASGVAVGQRVGKTAAIGKLEAIPFRAVVRAGSRPVPPRGRDVASEQAQSSRGVPLRSTIPATPKTTMIARAMAK